jgi:hypothetical protein
VIDLFIVDNGDKNRKARTYLHEWPDLAQKVDIALDRRRVQDAQWGHAQDGSNQGPQTVGAPRRHLRGGAR